MDVNEEIQEHSEEARGPFDRRVAATMAIIAALLAVVTVTGHIATTEELLLQQRASDQWAFYQAKAIRRYESDIARDVLGAIGSAAAAQRAEKYGTDQDRYQKESDEIQDKAKELQEESERKGREALRLHFGEVFLEIAIVISSLAILTKRAPLWWAGLASAAAGAAVAVTAILIR